MIGTMIIAMVTDLMLISIVKNMSFLSPWVKWLIIIAYSLAMIIIIWKASRPTNCWGDGKLLEERIKRLENMKEMKK